MQATATAPAQAPEAPASPATPTPIVEVQPGVALEPGVPRTSAEVQAMRARRSELSNQLVSATRRRDELVKEMQSLEGVARTGVEQRVALLDERILRIEAEIAETGRLLAASPAIATTSARPRDGTMLNSDQITAISIVFTIFVLFPIAIAWARRIFRKPLPPATPSPLLVEASQRLERLEHAVDAIAIEVERVSEGQRFVTRVLAQGQKEKDSIGSGM